MVGRVRGIVGGPPDQLGQGATLRQEMLAAFARGAAEGRLAVPIARTVALDEWGLAHEISKGGLALGKFVLLAAGWEAGLGTFDAGRVCQTL